MPKVPPTLHNHNERPFISCVLSVEASSSGHWSVSSWSTHIAIQCPIMAPQATEYFPVDFAGDLESISVHKSALDPGDLDVNGDPQPQESGVEGIKVKPPKAK